MSYLRNRSSSIVSITIQRSSTWLQPVLLSALVVRIIDAARSFDIIWVMTQGG
ncbi:hypothetical protein [Metabacillus sediminilitoris]|uniref:hypothetical protein n=1 Tax=Metabacillus sediminilitoris TaxID=2567941 RepID=UPI00399F0FB5